MEPTLPYFNAPVLILAHPKMYISGISDDDRFSFILPKSGSLLVAFVGVFDFDPHEIRSSRDLINMEGMKAVDEKCLV